MQKKKLGIYKVACLILNSKQAGLAYSFDVLIFYPVRESHRQRKPLENEVL
jgi:hypothetical protein